MISLAGPESVAAFVAEPVAGATLAGAVPTDDYWPAIVEVCRRHGILVIVDEVQLPLGRLRLRPSGSAGGHNGLKSVIEHVGSDFPRLRIGVDRGHPDWDLSDRVLSKFPPSERDIVGRAITRAADAVETFVSDGIHAAMNRFNTAEDQSTEEETRS